MTTVSASPIPILQFFNNSGQPNAGGSVLTQVGGVNYPTYSDSAGSVALPNPIPLNSRGEVSNASGQSSQLFLESGIVYTFTIMDVNGNTINTATSVEIADLLSLGAAGISANNTFTGTNTFSAAVTFNGSTVFTSSNNYFPNTGIAQGGTMDATYSGKHVGADSGVTGLNLASPANCSGCALWLYNGNLSALTLTGAAASSLIVDSGNVAITSYVMEPFSTIFWYCDGTHWIGKSSQPRVIGNPTGGDQGEGTINVPAIYANGIKIVAGINSQFFSSSGTFTAPYAGTYAMFICGGGGGGGGGSGGSAYTSGGGGGSSAQNAIAFQTLTQNQQITVTIGGGGAGGSGGASGTASGSAGNTGGSTTVGSITVSGGAGGGGGIYNGASVSSGGAGGRLGGGLGGVVSGGSGNASDVTGTGGAGGANAVSGGGSCGGGGGNNDMTGSVGGNGGGVNGQGGNGSGYGAGGGGGGSGQTGGLTGSSGGAGSPGIAFIWW